MRKVNAFHQEILDQALRYGLNLNLLRKKYNLLFVLKLFKYIKKETKNKNKKIRPIFPEKNFGPDVPTSDYINELESAGFKLKKYTEDFIDEDNGKVVTIKRFTFKPLK